MLDATELYSMGTYLIFGVNIGNLGRARTSRQTARKQVAAMNRALDRAKIPAKVIDSFATSGNFVLRTTIGSLKKTLPIIERALGAKVGIFPLEEIEEHAERVSATRKPLTNSRIRATPGLVLYVEGTV